MMAERKKNQPSRRLFLAILSIIVVILSWYVLTSWAGMIPPAFLPPPQYIISDFFRVLTS
ncbi:MAG: hypothetical protein H6Q42_4755, partial [Deltaproteobacteria bacterium]|nr:hypothetical protein [Deltaproteobacteria bacterium]